MQGSWVSATINEDAQLLQNIRGFKLIPVHESSSRAFIIQFYLSIIKIIPILYEMIHEGVIQTSDVDFIKKQTRVHALTYDF